MSSLVGGEGNSSSGKNDGRRKQDGTGSGSVIVGRIKGFARVRSFLLRFLLAAGEINSHGGGPSQGSAVLTLSL